MGSQLKNARELVSKSLRGPFSLSGRLIRVFCFLTLLLTSLFLPGKVRAQEAAKITFEDLLSVPEIGSPILSPDGTQFAFIRDGQIYLLPASAGWPAILTTTPGAKDEVSWSPDSKTLAFVSQGDIWVVASTGGPPVRLTSGVAGPGDPRGAADRSPKWNPSGKWILFQSGRQGRNDLWVVSPDGHSKNYLATTEIYGGRDRFDAVAAGEMDGVSSDSFDPSPSWSPDGTRISYTERSREYFSGRLKVLDFDISTGHAKGAAVELYTAKHDRGGAWAIDQVTWSPDGRTLAFTIQDSGWDKIYLLSSTGGQTKQLTQGESEDTSPVFSPDGKFLAIVSNRGELEESHIWIVPIDGSAPHQLTQLPPGVERQPQWSPDGAKVYFIRSAPIESPDLYVAAAAGKPEARALTQTTPLDFLAVGFEPPERVRFKGKDGLDLAGILYRPLGYKIGTRYPTVLWVHGGPEGQDTFEFTPWSLFLAQEGYVVFEPNYRGSDGYGEKFRNLNVEDSGGGEADDVAAAVGYLVNQSLADPKRVAIGGGSHGGTMVNYAVTKYPDLWAAAISLFGVADRATYIQRTNRNSAIRWETKMGGTPEEKPGVYRKADVLYDVPKIQTPLLVMYGEEDPQVPPYESVQLINALKKSGKTFVSFSYPHEGHGFTQPEHLLDAWKKQQVFLRKYLLSSDGRSSTSVEEVDLNHK